MNIGAIKDSSAYFVGAGAQTPVGRYVLAAAAAVRCGISAYAEHPFMIDKQGEAMVVARAGWLDETMPVEERIATLAIDAATEAIHPLRDARGKARGRVGIHLALSAENLADADRRHRVITRFSGGMAANGSTVAPVAEGHAGGMLALENALRQLNTREVDLCLVGGADSWLDPDQLETIDFAGRLHTVNNSWGFTPGEAAGFVLVTGGETVRRLGLTPLAELLAVATAKEPNVMGTRTICIGEGLTAAFRGALSARDRVSHSYCDFNGETYRAEEYGFAVCRTGDLFEDAGSFTAAAECWGDVGAASAPLAIALPLAAWRRGYGKGSVNLAWSSSAHAPLRGAALMRKFNAGGS